MGAGGYLGYRSQYDRVLSESEHVGKLKYLEHLIDEEYLGEVDQEKLAEGLYTGLVYGPVSYTHLLKRGSEMV